MSTNEDEALMNNEEKEFKELNPTNGDDDNGVGDDNGGMMSDDNEFDAINERLKQIDEETLKIREMQSEIEKQFNTSSSSTASASPAVPQALSLEEKMLVDRRSVHVANVDYSATPDQLQEHFRGCGPIERVTILADKYSGHPKGFAYIEFSEPDGMQTALSLTDSLFLGRQIKVTQKRTNQPGISSTNRPPRGRGRARMIVKYIYPTRGGLRGRPRRRGFAPY